MITAVKNRLPKPSTNGHAKKEATVEVPMLQLDRKTLKVTIVGTSPLIVHRFSEKARKMIEDKQQKKAKTAREAREPKTEFLAAYYVMPGTGAAGGKKTKYGIPASGVKNAMVSACRYIEGIPMTRARGMMFVKESPNGGGLVEIKYRETRMREDTVKLPNDALDMRYRPEFLDWSIDLQIEYNASVVSPEQIVNLLNNAGFSVGLCEWRPEKNGSYGMFTVK